MPTRITSTHKASFFRKGPFLKTRPKVRQLEGNAAQAFNALIIVTEGIPQAVFDHARVVVKDFTEVHSEEAKRDAGRFNVESGQLSGGFSTEVTSDKVSIRGLSRNNAKHAVFQELGFHHWRNGRYINPKPFMYPAFERSREGFLFKLREIFGK